MSNSYNDDGTVRTANDNRSDTRNDDGTVRTTTTADYDERGNRIEYDKNGNRINRDNRDNLNRDSRDSGKRTVNKQVAADFNNANSAERSRRLRAAGIEQGEIADLSKRAFQDLPVNLQDIMSASDSINNPLRNANSYPNTPTQSGFNTSDAAERERQLTTAGVAEPARVTALAKLRFEDLPQDVQDRLNRSRG